MAGGVDPLQHVVRGRIPRVLGLAIARSYPETGVVNESAVHWDMICDVRPGRRLSADGETIMENGIFRWPFEPGPRTRGPRPTEDLHAAP